VALHEPAIRGNEWAYLKECLDTTYVSSVGKFVDRFEAELGECTVITTGGLADLNIPNTRTEQNYEPWHTLY
jgi:hypothetical protein